jgi:GntR family transcriptional regulator
MKVVRVRSNEQGKAFAHYVSWTVGINNGFTKEKLETTPRLQIIKDNNINLTKIKQTLGANNASFDIAQQLNMKEGDALLSITRHSLNENDEIVDVIDCLYNPELFNYSMVLSLD